MHMKNRLVVLPVLAMVSFSAVAADRLIDRRMNDTGTDNRPVRVAAAKNGSANLVELLVQLENLQNEVKALRNQVEIQSHELNQLKESQRNAMRDTDARLSKLEQRRASTPAVSVEPAVKAPAQVSGPGVSRLPETGDAGKKLASAEPPVSKTTVLAQKDYDAAFQKLRDGMYKQAISDFEAFLRTYPKHKLASNAQYWIAKSHYVTRNYKQALIDFDKTIKGYPRSSKIPDAMLNKGYTLYDLGRYEEARKVLSATTKKYSGTRVGNRAKKRLDQMKKEGR